MIINTKKQIIEHAHDGASIVNIYEGAREGENVEESFYSYWQNCRKPTRSLILHCCFCGRVV